MQPLPPPGQQPPYSGGPYSQGPHQQGPYSTGPYYGPVDHPNGTTVLVLGIISLVACGVVIGPIAWIMGNKALKEIDAAPGHYTNRSNVSAGRVCGMVATILWAVGLIAYILFFVAIVAGSSRI